MPSRMKTSLTSMRPTTSRSGNGMVSASRPSAAATHTHGHVVARLYSRSGEDITKSFPDLVPSLHLQDSLDSKLDDSRKPLHTFRHQASFAIDGELLVVRDGRVQS